MNEAMRNEIIARLEKIERTTGVKILHAVESGSRAWGFESPDSDYDVRFIYVRKPEDYLKIQPDADVIEWELNEMLDINGWDLRKALQQAHRSNNTLFEWNLSPVVYKTTEDWAEIAEVISSYFSRKVSMYQYYGTARKNKELWLSGEKVRYKKYMYVLRPLLACRWIEEKGTPASVEFSKLEEAVLPEELVTPVNMLLAEKKQMSEADEGPRIPEIDSFIDEQLKYYKQVSDELADDRRKEWDPLNAAFYKCVTNVAWQATT